MNRKLLVNELLGWSDISETNNEQTLNTLQNHLKPYSNELKRQKTLPKKLRLIKKANQPSTEKSIDTQGEVIKKHLRFGINSITRELEKDATNLKFVLVCKSCKPILTRHIQLMCAKANIPAGCVKDLSTTLSKFFNLKTISAFAIVSKVKNDINQELLSQANGVLSDLANKIINLLPSLKHPFYVKSTGNLIVDVEMSHETLNQPQALVESVKSEAKMETSTFGSDFISFEESNTNISFNSNKFILFNDSYNDNDESEENFEPNLEENQVRIPKRKLTTEIQKSNDLQLNQFAIKIRPTNKDRKKKTIKINKNSDQNKSKI